MATKKSKDKRKDLMFASISAMGNQDTSDDLAFIRGKSVEEIVEGLNGEIRHISPSLLNPHPKNTFSMERDGAFLSLKDAIAEYGITNPIIATANEDGTYTIISGHRRTQAAKELGLKKVPVNIIPAFDSELDEIRLLGIENFSTRNPNAVDIARYLETLWEKTEDVEGKRKREVISEMLPESIKMSPRSVQNYLSILKLDDRFIELIQKGHILIGSAVKMAGAWPETTEEFRDELYQKVCDVIKNDADGSADRKVAALIDRMLASGEAKGKPKDTGGSKRLRDETLKLKNRISLISESEYILPKQKSKIAQTEEDLKFCINELNKMLVKLQSLE